MKYKNVDSCTSNSISIVVGFVVVVDVIVVVVVVAASPL